MEMYRTDEQHPAKSLSGMAALRKEGKLCDVVIKVGEKQFHAHKVWSLWLLHMHCSHGSTLMMFMLSYFNVCVL